MQVNTELKIGLLHYDFETALFSSRKLNLLVYIALRLPSSITLWSDFNNFHLCNIKLWFGIIYTN